jgi:hypothetical protein
MKRHINTNGSVGGLVASTAYVDPYVYVGYYCQVEGNACVEGNVRLEGFVVITEEALVSNFDYEDPLVIAGTVLIKGYTRLTKPQFITGYKLVMEGTVADMLTTLDERYT